MFRHGDGLVDSTSSYGDPSPESSHAPSPEPSPSEPSPDPTSSNPIQSNPIYPPPTTSSLTHKEDEDEYIGFDDMASSKPLSSSGNNLNINIKKENI